MEEAILSELRAIRRSVEAIEASLATSSGSSSSGSSGAAAGELDPNWADRRVARYLHAFVTAPEGKLHHTASWEAAAAAGYMTNGAIGGYFTYNGSLAHDGPCHVITDVGREVYEQRKHLLSAS
jgi:hypothetical protein